MVLVAIALPAVSHGAIIATQAKVSTTVQELLDGDPGTVSTDDRELDTSADDWTINASGTVESTDLGGQLVGQGVAFGDFIDPRRLDQPNPEEIGLELACYSNRESLSYIVEGEVLEQRTIIFTTAGSEVAEPDFDFGDSTTAAIESRIFVSGAIVLWSNVRDQPFESVSADLIVEVTRSDTDETVFSTTLNVAGSADGEVTITASGPIQSSPVTPDELGELGLDSDSVKVLNDLEEQGSLRILAIPEQEHAYRYDVTADESFDLAARFFARIRNVPNGTGVAVVLGRPFENLAHTIESALPDLDGAAFQTTLNKVVAKREVVVPNGNAGNPRLCGAISPPAAGALLTGLCLMRNRGNRRFK